MIGTGQGQLKLFDLTSRTGASPQRHQESRFAFLNRVSTYYFEQVRMVLDNWFDFYPEVAKDDIRARFRSDDFQQHGGAFWELYLHEVFRRLEFTARVHPSVPSGTKAPDYHFERDKESFYLEAVMVTDSERQIRKDALRNHIVDAIRDRVKNPSFMLDVQIDIDGKSLLRTSKLCRDLNGWLDTLETSEAPGIDLNWNRSDFPQIRWQDRDWRLRVSALPVPPDQRNRTPDSIIGIYPADGGMVADHLPINDRLRRKASKYGELDRPYVIALLYSRSISFEHQVKQALFGDSADESDTLKTGTLPSWWPKELDGFWITRGGPRRSNVSAVLAATDLSPWSIAQRAPRLWVNAWAQRPLETFLPFERNWVDTEFGKIRNTPATLTPSGILGLFEKWPEGEPFP